ncbi:hypothetical protein P8C59_005681 [Phyllachora maydis]|uniref:Phospholipid/glycerol acyltransferase domain-containing protein n=1 Tax=Phyllachora maydis TaxID=1825666 RepID=A0AAD9I4W4_9PEZI|nr:hypothetical protein P8C59_005681 [Phyllachora maydis]
MPSSPATAAATAALTQLRGLALTFPWLLYLLLADILLSLLLPLKPLVPDLVHAASSRIAFTVWRWIQALFERANGAHVAVSGDALPRRETAVVVANHVAWADFYLVQALAVRAGMLGHCRWFAKRELRLVPFLGWGLWAMGMPMVSRRWARDQAELDRVFRGIVRRRWPVWLIAFSEATRYTPAKAAASARWCAAAGRPQPRHLLYPRTKGFVATVRQLRRAPHVRAVYDLAIAYQCRGGSGGGWLAAPTMWETLSVPDLSAWRFHVHVRRFPIEDLPEDEEGLARWLEARWVEKGEWLEGKRREWAGEAEGGGEGEREHGLLAKAGEKSQA